MTRNTDDGTVLRTTATPALAHLVRPHVAWFSAMVLLEVVAGVAGLAPLLAVAELARLLSGTGAVDSQHVWIIVAAGAGGLGIRLLAGAGSVALGHVLDTTVQLRLRRALAEQLGRAPLGWLVSRRTGELSKVVGDDVGAVHALIAHTPGALATAVIVPLVVLAYLATIDWALALIALTPVLAALTALPWMMTPSRLREQSEFDAGLDRVASSALEFVQGISEVKVLGGAARAHGSFRRAVDEFVGSFSVMVRGLSRPAAMMQLMLAPPSVLLVVLVGGSWRIAHGHIPAADLAPFLLLSVALTAPVAAMLGHSFEDVQTARRALRRVVNVLRVAPLPEPHEPFEPTGEQVRLSGVHFAHGDREVLRGVDLTLEPGTITAVVGPSGSGKSTLAALIPRFFDPTEGSVSIGDVDLRDLGSEHLRTLVSFVFQDTALLRASVADNIALAVPHAQPSDIAAAARLAHIHERILELPRGYETVIGEEVVFSGGEAQRVAIARALLARTPILVLDEATAFADPANERAIRQTLTGLRGELTMLVVAHRLETIAESDLVAVLDDGRVVESGAPTDLVAQGGSFTRLWRAHVQAAEHLLDARAAAGGRA